MPAPYHAYRRTALVPLHSDFDWLIGAGHGCPDWSARPDQRVKINVQGYWVVGGLLIQFIARFSMGFPLPLPDAL
jgi:hypothetical protein